jgi:hypothetical protein
MGKATRVTSTLRDAHDVQNVWQSIPAFTMGEVRLEIISKHQGRHLLQAERSAAIRGVPDHL